MESTSPWNLKNHRAGILSIINQIQELTKGCKFVICHGKREANEAAHTLAKFASCSNPEWNSQVQESILRCNEQACKSF